MQNSFQPEAVSPRPSSATQQPGSALRGGGPAFSRQAVAGS
jgi:hypothetical protein